MSTKVFISYRREDSGFAARGVHDRLARELGSESLFMDVDAIALGLDFVEVLSAEVAKCDVLLAIIGPSWLEARDEDGNRRLDSEHDFVRIEIAAALQRNIRVIPILLEGTRIPRAERLPDDVKPLARRNGLDVRHASFPADMDRLVNALHRASPPPAPPLTPRPVAPPEPTSIGEAVAPPETEAKDQTAPPPALSGSGAPVAFADLPADARRVEPPERGPPAETTGTGGSGGEAKREPPAKATTPVSTTGLLIGMGLVAAATLLGVLYYVFVGTKEREPSILADATQAEAPPSIPRAADPPPAAKAASIAEQQKEPAGSPGSEFKECAACPVMVVIRAGKFTMGSPKDEEGRYDDEGPQHVVTIAKPFVVSKYGVTFAEWDACVAASACPKVEDRWGRGSMPVINVSWNEAKQYVGWLSKVTGKPYRLLTEAEWEYAARGGTQTAYSWGVKIGTGNANCNGCGSRWDNKQTAPVGSFKPNAFGLDDMHGNVWEWVEDCFHSNYDKAPRNGSAWIGGDCGGRVVRGGTWVTGPRLLRAAFRLWYSSDGRYGILGFRVARTLTP
jgi:formylglycine-generating enzyme required for sulfatase activity